MTFKKRVQVTTAELQGGDTVLMKNDTPWTVREIYHDGRVIIINGDRTATGRCEKWTVLREVQSVDTTDYLTVQEYLIGCGMERDRLETAAKTFGTVLAAQFRKRHGKDVKPEKKLEYVHYLDTTGGLGEGYTDEQRTRTVGWYESNCYAPSDRDLLDAVKEKRHPSLGAYRTAENRAIEVLVAHGFETEEVLTNDYAGDVKWLAEDQIKRCAASGTVCGHEACARRRGAQWRGSNTERESDMFG